MRNVRSQKFLLVESMFRHVKVPSILKHFLTPGLLLVILMAEVLFSPTKTNAITTGAMPIGAIIQMSGMKFVKVTSNCLFVGLEVYQTCETISKHPPTTMQDILPADCACLNTCSIGDNCENNGSTLTLTDARDGKSYRIRKFADGHCWMIDNLAYGGSTTDGCSGKSTFDGGYTSVGVGYSVYGVWTGSAGASSESFYGSCLDPKGMTSSDGDSTYCTTHNCGYFYSWQAAMQQSLAYYGSNYTGSAGNNGAGICPAGWLLPPNAGDGSFYNLHTTYSSPTSPNFWANTTYWNGVYSGASNGSGALYGQASYADYWSSTQYNTYYGYVLCFATGGNVYPQSHNYKNLGQSVRCVF